MTVADHPALGVILNRLDIQRRRRERVGCWQRSLDDYRARTRAMARIVKIHEGLRSGRRFDLVAGDLRRLADAIDEVPRRLLELDVERQELAA